MRGDFLIIGATGMQGRITARDLLENGYSVVLCGRDGKRIQYLLDKYPNKTTFHYLELSDGKALNEILSKTTAKVVINCAEGDWDLVVLKACLKAGISCIDLGSEMDMTRDQLALHPHLAKKGITHITGCGSVPGVGNVMLRYAAEKLDSVEHIDVGFVWDSNIPVFVVPFSIESVIEEFTSPAPLVEDGHFVYKKTMDSLNWSKGKHENGKEKIPSKREIPRQRIFYVRHPEPYTFHHYYKARGLKTVHFYAGFPEHSFNAINSFVRAGFANKEPIMVDGKKIKPIHFLTSLLRNMPTPKEYRERENLWIDVYGKVKGKKRRISMECIVPTLPGWESAGCNIDTGMPASIMAEMIYKDIITHKGSFAPEAVVPIHLFFKELAKRKMHVYENGKKIN